MRKLFMSLSQDDEDWLVVEPDTELKAAFLDTIRIDDKDSSHTNLKNLKEELDNEKPSRNANIKKVSKKILNLKNNYHLAIIKNHVNTYYYFKRWLWIIFPNASLESSKEFNFS
jgi:hypothetical protein